MKRTVVNGIVKNVEAECPHLTFVTLIPLDEWHTEMRVPVYMALARGFVGKPLDVVNTREGIFGRKFKQTIETADVQYSVEMPYSIVKQINDSYKRFEARRALGLS